MAFGVNEDLAKDALPSFCTGLGGTFGMRTLAVMKLLGIARIGIAIVYLSILKNAVANRLGRLCLLSSVRRGGKRLFTEVEYPTLDYCTIVVRNKLQPPIVGKKRQTQPTCILTDARFTPGRHGSVAQSLKQVRR